VRAWPSRSAGQAAYRQRCARVAVATTSVPSNNIARPEGVSRTLNTNFGGESSPTDRLWNRYRSELAERDKRTGTRLVGAEKIALPSR
jgi:hypothetical protein